MEDKYRSYTTIQLTGEEAFLRWVLHGEHKDEWSGWLKENPSFFEKIEEARQIILSLSQIPGDNLQMAERNELWNRIDSSIKVEKKQPSTEPLKSVWTWTLTAAAALALLFWFNSIITSNKVFAQAGQHKNINLPEESIITLNAGSAIAYKSRTFEKDRILKLEGEAFFSVKPGSSFTVKTEYGTVTVLGTSFNVISRQGQFEVSCYTGKVSVETKDQDQVVIQAGERSIQNPDNLKLNRTTFVPTGTTPEWTDGKFTFEDQPLTKVIAELERQYGIKVQLKPGLEELKYTGLFESGDLEKALSLITWPLHLKANVRGKTVTISD